MHNNTKQYSINSQCILRTYMHNYNYSCLHHYYRSPGAVCVTWMAHPVALHILPAIVAAAAVVATLLVVAVVVAVLICTQ